MGRHRAQARRIVIVALIAGVLASAGGVRLAAEAANQFQACPAMPAPDQDPFYTAPSPMPSGAPGTVVRSRSVCISGVFVSYQAWQLMYLSTGTEDANGNPSELNASPAVDITTLIVPSGAPFTSPRPLVSYQIPEDANTEASAPSYKFATGNAGGDVATVEPFLAEGVAVAIPDHEGLLSEFGAGVQSGHAVLDGVRAAEGFAPGGLGGAATAVGLLGYSGGAMAAGWATELAPTYAPELHVVGLAEGGVPADTKAVFNNINGGPFASLAFDAAVGDSIAYPNLFYDEKPNPGNGFVGGNAVTGLATVANTAGQQMAAQIQAGTGNTPAYSSIASYTWCGCNPADYPAEFPGIAQLSALDNMGQPNHVPRTPIFIYEAYFDELVPFAGAQTLVNTYCAEGVPVAFKVDYTSEHVSLAVKDAPLAHAYLLSRLKGVTAPSTCGLPFNGGAPNPPVNPGGLLKGQIGPGS